MHIKITNVHDFPPVIMCHVRAEGRFFLPYNPVAVIPGRLREKTKKSGSPVLAASTSEDSTQHRSGIFEEIKKKKRTAASFPKPCNCCHSIYTVSSTTSNLEIT